MKKLLIFLIPVIVFGCKQDTSKNEQSTEETNVPRVTITCEDMGTVGDMYKNAIYATIDEQKTKLMEINAACMALKPENYDSYGIPADAIAAMGSWFAGLGDYFYAKQEGEKIVFYYAAIAEEISSDRIKYYKLATYENGKIALHELQ